MTAWWNELRSCPGCGQGIFPSLNESKGVCSRCAATSVEKGNVTDWTECDAGGARLLPVAWLEVEKVVGLARTRNLVRASIWNLLKLVGFPIRYAARRRLSIFLSRSLNDKGMAEHWRSHYLKGLELKAGDLIFEYSYRKAEKIGFPILLGFRVVIQDIRKHSWWTPYPHAWFQSVPAEFRYLPLQTGKADMVFTDGLIFDFAPDSLENYFYECYRILRPGGYLIAWCGNSLAPSRARSEIRWHGRIYTLEYVRSVVRDVGFAEIDVSFEGYSPPVFPILISMIRQALSPFQFKTYDFDSWMAKWQRPEKRAYWLLRLERPLVSGEAKGYG